jgi:hypothetical protein
MDTPQWLRILSLVIIAGSYLVLFVATLRLARVTRKIGFAFLAVGFGFWIMEQLILLLAPTSFLLSYSGYYSLLYPLGLILIVVGFFKLVGADCRRPH